MSDATPVVASTAGSDDENNGTSRTPDEGGKGHESSRRGKRGERSRRGGSLIGQRPDQVEVHSHMIHGAKALLQRLGIDTDPNTTQKEFAIVTFTAPPVPRESERAVELHPLEINDLPKDTPFWVDDSKGEGSERYFMKFDTEVLEEPLIESGHTRGVRTPLHSCFKPIPGKQYECIAIVDRRGKGDKTFLVQRVMPLYPDDMSSEELGHPEPSTRQVAFVPCIRRDRRDKTMVSVAAMAVDKDTGKNIVLGDGYLSYMTAWNTPVFVVLHETPTRLLAIPAARYEEAPEAAAAEARQLVLSDKPEHLEPGTFYYGRVMLIVPVLEAAVRDGLIKSDRTQYLPRSPGDPSPIIKLSIKSIGTLRKKLLEKFGPDKLEGVLTSAQRRVDEAELERRTARFQLITAALDALIEEQTANSNL